MPLDPLSTETDHQAARSAVPRPAGLGRPAISVAMVALMVAWSAVMFVLLRADGPILFGDEAGYLFNARRLAFPEVVPSMGENGFYHAGYSLFLVLPILLGTTPAEDYTLVLAVNVLAASSVIPLAYAIAKGSFRLERSRALLLGVLAASYPAVGLLAGLAWADAITTPTVLACTLLVSKSLGRDSWRWRLTPWIATAGAYAVHPRLAVLGLALVVTMALVASRGGLPWSHLLVGVAVATSLIVGVEALHDWLAREMWVSVTANDAGSFFGSLSGRVRSVGWSLVGQVWYLAVASLGLALVGLLGSSKSALAVLTSRSFLPKDVVGTFVGVSSLGALVLASVSLAGAESRADFFTYGRYIEPFLVALLLWGAARLIAGGREVLLEGVWALAGVGLAGFVYHFRMRSVDLASLPLNNFNILGIDSMRRIAGGTDVRVIAGLSMLGGLVVVLADKRREIGVGVVALVMAGLTVSTAVNWVGPVKDNVRATLSLPSQVDEAGGAEVVWFDDDLSNSANLLSYQWDLETTVFRRVSADSTDLGSMDNVCLIAGAELEVATTSVWLVASEPSGAPSLWTASDRGDPTPCR